MPDGDLESENRGSPFEEPLVALADLRARQPAIWLDSGKVRKVRFDKSESGVI
jgi:hypothetical protein